jgi:hypothetical protein
LWTFKVRGGRKTMSNGTERSEVRGQIAEVEKKEVSTFQGF